MKVFISHSRQNGSAALKLCDRLGARGIQAWLDLRELDSGADWNPRVAEAIRDAEGFAFLVGPGTTPDQFQRFEWQHITEGEYYLDPDKPLVPVVIGDTELPGFLRTRKALRVDPSSIDFDTLADQVAKALSTPSETIDHESLERGLAARKQALESLKSYSRDLDEGDVKQAALRGLKAALPDLK
jgi:hypothetical protein